MNGPKSLRTVAVSTTAAAVLLLAACGGGGGSGLDSSSSTSGDSRPYAGVTLSVSAVNHPWTDRLKEALPEFEEATGINVEVNAYNDEQLAQLYNVKLNAASDELDVLMIKPLQDSLQMAHNGWLEPLTELVESDAEWDWNDFQESARASVMVDGEAIGVPVSTETAILFYRKDLLQELGLEVPTTMDQLKDAAEAIHEAHPDIYGFGGRGEKSAAVTQFSSFLYSLGGNWVDSAGNAAIDTPEAIAAYNLYGGMLLDYGPPGEADMNWSEIMGLFQQGLVAFYPESSSRYNNAMDPDESTVADVTGVTSIPAGPAGARPYNITAFALAVNSASNNKDAAWEFVKWASSKDIVMRFQKDQVPGARTSVWSDPEGTESIADDLLEVIQASSSGDSVGYDRPTLEAVAEAREIVGNPIVVAIQGGDVEAAAREANEQFQGLLDAEK